MYDLFLFISVGLKKINKKSHMDTFYEAYSKNVVVRKSHMLIIRSYLNISCAFCSR